MPDDISVTGGYTSDLLSDVMANAKDGYIWITNQKHQNCVAVASLLNLSAIIIAGGVQPDENTIEKAIDEHVPVFTTDISVFDVTGELYKSGLRG
jgi:predicted transcriptional regulator